MPQPAIPKEILSKIRHIQIRTNQLVDDVLGGAYRSTFKGRGMEFEEVREYQSGDEVRHIDWNVTARMNHPHVKNFREERELTVILVVDISASLRFGSESQLKKELSAEIAAIIAFSAIKNNDKVGLILFSSEIELYIPPKRGLRHVLRVIRELLLFEGKKHTTDVNAALTFLGHVQKQRCICFLLSDFLCPPFDQTVAVTARKHDFTAISITDQKEMQLPPIGMIHLHDLENHTTTWIDSSSELARQGYHQQALKEMEKMKKAVKKAGGGFIALQTGLPYTHSLRKYFQTRKRYAMA
jgi:uncharacterized protein (DUF58 family)